MSALCLVSSVGIIIRSVWLPNLACWSSCQASSNKWIEAADQWVAWDPNETTRREIKALRDANNTAELEKRLSTRLAFGTAGLRGPMGAGYPFMNDLVVLQSTQGFCRYLQSVIGKQALCKRGVVIGYDARHNSRDFARIAASVFVSEKVPVLLYSRFVPTPWVPFAIKRIGAAAGIMVTASHNPKQDNGYKVYWGNGAQIIPPHDAGIAKEISKNLAPWEIDLHAASSSPLVSDRTDEMTKAYFETVTADQSSSRASNASNKVRIAYTPVHGVGAPFVDGIFAAFNLPPVHHTPLQRQPDPEFSTVTFPNPEEGKGVLALAMETASKAECRLILANDPDADRLAVAEQQSDGKWIVLSGNDIGILFAWWQLQRFKSAKPGADLTRVVMINSCVSSKMLRALCHAEGCRFEETLTGFKWMANRGFDVEQEGTKVLFAYEEAIGFMNGTSVWDKDGVSGAAVFAELAEVVAKEGGVVAKLKQLQAKYGKFLSNNRYVICRDPAKIERIFHRLRTQKDGLDGRYHNKVGSYPVTGVRDLTTGYDTSQADKKARMPPSKEMLTYSFANGAVLTLRTSGTEPKIKYYCELPTSPADEVKSRGILDDLVQHVIDDLLEAKANKLEIPPPS